MGHQTSNHQQTDDGNIKHTSNVIECLCFMAKYIINMTEIKRERDREAREREREVVLDR